MWREPVAAAMKKADTDAATTASSRALSGTGPGMKFNMTAKLGYEYRPYKPIAIIFEPVSDVARAVDAAPKKRSRPVLP